MTIKRPEELDADTLWKLLGWYADGVGQCEGVYFTSNKYVLMAADQWVDKYGSSSYEEAPTE